MKTGLLIVLALALPVLTACVSSAKYDQAVTQNKLTSARLQARTESLEQANRDLELQRGEITDLENKLAIETKNKGAQVGDLQKRLEELRAMHATAEQRAAMFRDLAKRLEKEISVGEMSIILRDQRMVLQLPNDVLFDTGRTELKPAGKTALTAVASALKAFPERQFQVAGHTDNVPIGTAPFASNWELSSARALRVVHFLLAQGVSPGELSAAGYGETDPVVPNDTKENKQKNRRTEITLLPSIDEIIKVP